MLNIIKCFTLIIFCCNVIYVSNANSATINASSCSVSDVRNAVNSANDGDTVIVPAGNCTWTDGILVSDKEVSIIGSGIDSTNITNNVPNAWGSTPFWMDGGTGGKSFRISGFTFIGSTAKGAINIQSDYTGWRIDNNKFNGQKVGRGIVTSGYGVIDHNIFVDTAQGVRVEGPKAWTSSLDLGTENFVYIENNIFDYTDEDLDGVLDAYNGGRYVFRYNTVNNAPIGHHGTCTDIRGTQAFEIYRNTFNATVSIGGRVMNFRAGTGIVYNNTAITPGSFAYVSYYRSCYPEVHANCDEHRACDGSQSYDGNTAGTNGTGSHSGSSNSVTLVDSSQNWTADEWVGYWIWNTTDGSMGLVTANTATTVTATLVEAPEASGSHWGGDNAAALVWDPGTVGLWGWTVNEWVGATIQNVSDGSSCIITYNTASTATCTLAGGTDNDWDSPTNNADEFRIFSGTPEKDWDSNDTYKITNGYPCFDQPGVGTEGQDLEPIYEWNNTLNGSDGDIGIAAGECDRARSHIVEGREFVNDTQRPGYIPYTYPHPLTIKSTPPIINN